MRGLLFLAIILPLVFLVASEFQEVPEEALSEKERIVKQLEDLTFNKPMFIDLLFHEEKVDKQAREKIKTFILQTNEEYLPRSQRIKDKSDEVLKLVAEKLQGTELGAPVGENASYFRWLTADAEWTVSSVETSMGHFSRWEKRSDVFSVTNQ